MQIEREKFTFDNGRGESLAARLERPREPLAYALFAHCFTCSKDIAAASRISRALCGQGIGVLRFDFTGLGNSDGDFSNTNFSSNVEDLVAAAAALGERLQAPRLLIGHSLGGAAVLAAASSIQECRAVATIGAPADPGHVEHLLQSKLDEIEEEGSATVVLAGREFRIKKQFLEDIRSQSLQERIGQLKRALLIFHSPLDKIVGIDQAAAIFSAAKHPKSFVSLDDADHLLNDQRDSQYVARVLAAWASRFLQVERDGQGEADGTSDHSPEGTVVVEEDGPRFLQAVRARRHVLKADEPSGLGGGDGGMTPYELLQAALGACTAITLRMYADRKEWPLDKVRVELRYDKIHAQDCRDCQSKEGKVDRIRERIEVTGHLDQSQRRRLLEISKKCPVYRTLTSEVHIESELA
ncbi:MAG TPA: bifunctional alpha/beta hydrolase/OsmC family protein [Acidobacteriota bacterium]|nr:bifunctional alpha/beta hydrolase/OsmC family protein [Acidobacteriota bacterium]